MFIWTANVKHDNKENNTSAHQDYSALHHDEDKSKVTTKHHSVKKYPILSNCEQCF